MSNPLIVRQLGIAPYNDVWQAMKSFTDNRVSETPDELWLVEHPQVFTQGQAGKAEHLLVSGKIPVVQADRGGQITYHGPGQQVVYVLVNLRRRKMGIRQLVTLIEESIIGALADYNIDAQAKPDAPGVYVNGNKIASLGLRVRKGCSFHGLALNVNMDMTPFLQINPCGYAGLEMTQTSDVNGPQDINEAGESLVTHLSQRLNTAEISYETGLKTFHEH